MGHLARQVFRGTHFGKQGLCFMCLVKQHRGGSGEKRESGDSVDSLILVVS